MTLCAELLLAGCDHLADLFFLDSLCIVGGILARRLFQEDAGVTRMERTLYCAGTRGKFQVAFELSWSTGVGHA